MDDYAVSATSNLATSAPYVVSEDEAKFYYYGISPSPPRLFYRTDLLTRPWVKPQGLEAYHSPKRAIGVFGHKLNEVWDEVGKKVRDLLEQVAWTSIDVVQFITDHDGKEAKGPVVIWVGVHPTHGANQAEQIFKSAGNILELLKSYDLTTNKAYCLNGTDAPRMDVQLLGTRAFDKLLENIKLRINHHRIISDHHNDRLRQLVGKVSVNEEIGDDDDELAEAKSELTETRELLKKAKKSIEGLEKFYSTVKRDWKGFTEDWEMFQVDKEKFPKSFTGNVIDLGTEMAPDKFTFKMYPRHDGKTPFKIPSDRLLTLHDIITKERLRKPNMLDHDNKPRLIVIKSGSATGIAIERATGPFSFVRDENTVRTLRMPFSDASVGRLKVSRLMALRFALTLLSQTMAASTKAAAKAAEEQKDKKPSTSKVGAPSQRSQSSRKGKRAWRKNIDIDEVEEGLETIRTEERVTGTAVQKKTNDELFVIDVTGDDTVRHTLPKFSRASLTSTKILAQRSAVPAVYSRSTSASSNAKRKRLTHEEKERLLRIGKRMRHGPFNAVVDPTETGEGSALLELSEAAKQSGQYSLWDTSPNVTAVHEEDSDDEIVDGVIKKRKVKAPTLSHPREHIQLSAVPAPHEGISYNPPVNAHQELLRTAHEKETQRVKEAEEQARTKETMQLARKTAAEDEVAAAMVGVPTGMIVQEVDETEVIEETDEVLPAKKAPERKTKQQRKKAERLRAERRALAEKLAQKRLLASVNAAKALRKSVGKTATERERQRQERHQKELQEKLSKGMAGMRLGKHVVPEGQLDVQLSEDLTESLRGLKPEGNLFKDRFLNMQQRALVEPRAPVIPKRKAKMKEYEKHAWKRFDREQGVLKE
ncbi:hypothetical protein EIP86_009353 [Pleurotus ostreatoroseus]|nr:hypothetical protein EIP86_009353 [Pleurotus ostreatoroseus]